MDLTETAMWVLVEEAVIQDRGEDEEEVLSQMVRAYLARRGLADTLHAFDAEEHAYRASTGTSEALPTSEGAAAGRAAMSCGGGARGPAAPSRHADHEMDRRRAAQLLCLQQRFEAAAALMPPTSLARIRLLCLQAQHLPDIGEAVFFLATDVAPLVPFCASPVLGHQEYTATLSDVLDPDRRTAQLDLEALAKEVNDELCGGGHPSSLNVLFNWAYWQETSS